MTTECSPEREKAGEPEGSAVTLRGIQYVLRPLSPNDEQRLQDFFHSHSQETIQFRYGHMIGTLTHERAYELVSVDQLKDVALGVLRKVGKARFSMRLGVIIQNTSRT
jgi:hypothetical protein